MNVVLVHGSFGKPFENWFPWLEKNLTEKGIECIIPTFPTPNNQNYYIWEELMNYYYKQGIINGETILIGHSCGAAFLTKFLINNNVKVKKLITVSGYNNFYGGDDLMDKLNGSFYVDEQKFVELKSKVEDIISFYSNNDPFIDQNTLKKFADLLGGKHIVVANAGHFNQSSGFNTFEQIMQYIV